MEQEKPRCKLVKYKTESQSKPTILLGIILSEDNRFINFKTARNEYQINKSCILLIQDTQQIFEVSK